MKTTLMEVMREFYDEGVPTGIVHRDIEYVEKPRAATVVKGMRRTGKTFVTYERMQALIEQGIPLGRIIHVNFEDERLAQLTVEHLRLIGEIHAEIFPEHAHDVCWYFLDEIQNVDGWESYVRRLVDSKLARVCLTGSSSKLLSEEIATQMRGRSLPIEVFPLSFSEFIRFNNLMPKIPRHDLISSREKGLLRHAMALYFERGGFPDVQDLSNRMRTSVLQGYVDAVLYRDILERHPVKSVTALKYTIDYLLHNYAHKASTRAIAGVLKNLSVSASREDISEYIGYLKNAYLIYPVSIHSGSLAVKRVNPEKYYAIDTGLIRAMNVKTDSEQGWLLENLVFLILRRKFDKLEYYLTKDGREIDFYATDMTKRASRLIQVSWDMSSEDTRKRELAAMRTAMEETGLTDCVIVTWDEDERTDDGIRIAPVWKWALEEDVFAK